MTIICEEKETTFRKEKFSYINQSYWDEESQMSFVDEVLETANINQVYNQYREKHNIPFVEEIKDIRKKYGLPANKMSAVFGFGVNQWRLYEEGEIPSSSNSLLIHSAKHPQFFLRMLQERKSEFSEKDYEKFLKNVEKQIELVEKNFHQSIIEQYIFGDRKATKFTGYKIPNWEKISQVVAFFSFSMQPLKTTMNKLLYYADAMHYRETGFSITGLKYKAIQYGNVPENFDFIFNKLDNENVIERKYLQFNNGNEGEKFLSSKFQQEIFSESEMTVLTKVFKIFKSKKPQEVVDICHEEKSWAALEKSKGLIDYEYSFYLKVK